MEEPASLGLSRAEYQQIEAELRRRGLDRAPTLEAWLRTELVKAALRKRSLPSVELYAA